MVRYRGHNVRPVGQNALNALRVTHDQAREIALNIRQGLSLCFRKGKFCIIAETPVNKRLAMLQMLVAQSGHEKDPHAASALLFLQQATGVSSATLTLMQHRLSVAVVARGPLCIRSEDEALAALSERVS
jgi:hypothetical protein